MYKKGKNWCYMAIATLAIAVGALSVSQGVSADTVDSAVKTTSVTVASPKAQDQTTDVAAEVTPATQSTSEMAKQDDQANSTTQTDQQSSATNKSAVAPQAAALQNGWQTDKGSSYYYKDGQKVTGQQTINGKNYYFNAQGQQQKNYFLNQANHTYYFQADGTRLDDGFYNNWGHTYYFQKDGSRLDNGFYNNWGHTYYFGQGGVRLDDGFYNNWGHTYYFQKDGSRLDNGFYNNWGHTYYFGQGGVRLDDGFYNNWGHTYYFQKDGSRLDNGFYNNWGHTYYFGNDGARWDNRWYSNWGHKYYFGQGGALATNTFFNTLGVDGDYDAHWADGSGIVSDVHYFSQYTPVFAPWGCAGASLAMLLSIKNVYPNLYDLIHNEPNVYGSRNQGWNGGQSGNVTTGAGFDHVIQPNALSSYGQKFYGGIRDISYTNLSKIAQVVQSGHPVLYYGWSAYDAGGNRNHCKVILGYNAHNNTFHVYDPLYGYKGRWTAHSTGGNAYDLGNNAWVPAWHIQGEMSGQALSIY